MSKRKSRYFGGGSGSSAKSIDKSIFRLDEDEGERPNPKNRSFFYDAVDEFHNSKEKVPLERTRQRNSDSTDEEIYQVRISSESEGENEEETEEIEIGAEGDEIQSDIEENNEDYLPSAEAWGKKRKTFYSTDYVDKDYAGYSESDEEAAQLEEVEAKRLQKNLIMQMNESDFQLAADFLTPSKPENQKMTEKIETNVVINVSQLNDEEKLQVLEKESPELFGLIEEYKEKKEIIENRLKPVVDALIEGKFPSTICLNFIRLRFEAYSNYLINLQFYFLLKASQTSIKYHPVIDRIVEWKKVINEIDEKCANLDEDLKELCEKLSNGEDFSTVEFFDKKKIENSLKIKLKTKINVEKEEQNRLEEFYDDFETTEAEGDAKRAATYEILKNKGTTPRRKKEYRNPRVKHRVKFQKALHKKRSQMPDVKREIKKYAGEERGIKPNLVRSVKLN